jgi:hypothetical protein
MSDRPRPCSSRRFANGCTASSPIFCASASIALTTFMHDGWSIAHRRRSSIDSGDAASDRSPREPYSFTNDRTRSSLCCVVLSDFRGKTSCHRPPSPSRSRPCAAQPPALVRLELALRVFADARSTISSCTPSHRPLQFGPCQTFLAWPSSPRSQIGT